MSNRNICLLSLFDCPFQMMESVNGNLTVKVLPAPNLLITSRLPRSAMAIAISIAKPNLEPFLFEAIAI